MTRYIVTDLTRFSNLDTVCTAVINTETGECLRPMPYLASKVVEKLNKGLSLSVRGNDMLMTLGLWHGKNK